MSWGIVAGSAISVVGGVMSSNSASKAADKAARASGNALAFEQQKYDEWQQTYGPIEDNLSDYYSSLTPEFYTSVGLENQQNAMDTSMQRINESLAQRGIEPSSGIAASLESQAQLEGAEQRAQIRRDAPAAVAKEKMNFLQVGLGQQPGASMSQALQNESSRLQQQANISEQAAGQAVGNAVTTVGTGLSDYLDKEFGEDDND